MQSWTLTFLLALAGTAIAMPAAESAGAGNIVARGLEGCCTYAGSCICYDSASYGQRGVDMKHCKNASPCDASQVPPAFRGSSS
ncbi:hypothetical protein HOO65_050469 [Ceratocystis lukuohia]|uniref:Extracellular membrane protein CFEM domain-containing protein n=1 Tax=Ceratocystis lukuohia TaxID=2019550 RepID=A0ABR4MGE6_9PEZI